jgi:hypothetical protein
MIRAGFSITKHPSGGRESLIHLVSFRINSAIKKDNAANVAAAGIVKTQAQTIRPATLHFTADNRVVDPTPAIAPVIV